MSFYTRTTNKHEKSSLLSQGSSVNTSMAGAHPSRGEERRSYQPIKGLVQELGDSQDDVSSISPSSSLLRLDDEDDVSSVSHSSSFFD